VGGLNGGWQTAIERLGLLWIMAGDGSLIPSWRGRRRDRSW